MEKLLSVSEVGEVLGLGKTRAWEEVTSGRLPSVRIGRLRRVAPADLATFIEDHREFAEPPHISPPRGRLGAAQPRALRR